MKELDIADSQFKPKSVQIEISNAKNKFVGVEEYQLLAGKEYFLGVVARIYKRYQEKLPGTQRRHRRRAALQYQLKTYQGS